MAKSDWKWSKQTTDGTLTVYDCSYIDEDETFKKRGVSVRDIPQEGRQSLADLVRLDVNEFEDWINFINYSPDSKRLGVNIENVWLNSYRADWNWKKSDDHTNETQVAYKCPGWKCSKNILKKIRARQITIEDIPEDARRTLADLDKLDLTEYKNWCKLQYATAEPTGIEVCIYIHRVWINHNEENWNWEKIGDAEDKTLAVYNCPGWKCTQKVLDRLNSRKATTIDIPKDAREKLAKIVDLAPEQLDDWVYKFEAKATLIKIEIEIQVPNVWICADLLRGGTPLDYLGPGLGGTLGQVPSHLRANKKVIFCKTIDETAREIAKQKGKLWGMILFAHGTKAGTTTSNWTKWAYGGFQTFIMDELDLYDYKLSKIYMMQCFSGYTGMATYTWVYEKNNTYASDQALKDNMHNWINNNLGHRIKNLKVDVTHTDKEEWFIVSWYNKLLGIPSAKLIKVTATFDVDWDKEWRKYSKNEPFTYKDENWFLIDIGRFK